MKKVAFGIEEERTRHMGRRGSRAGRRRGRRIVFACMASLLAVSAFTVAASATVLTGSLRTAFYTQQSRQGDLPFAGLDQKGELQTRSQLLQNVRLDARQLGVDWLSFHTAFTGTNVLTDQAIGDTRFRLYRLYFQRQASIAGMPCEARLGRHWLSAGVGSGTLDGLSFRLHRRGVAEFAAYFGTLGTDRITRTDKFWSLDKPDESRAFGGRIRVEHGFGLFQPRLAVSFRQTQRTPHSDLVTDSRLLGVHADLGFKTGRGDGSRSLLDDLRLWGDLKRNLLNGFHRVDRDNISAAVGAEYLGAGNGVTAYAEYERRRPDLLGTSFFAAFDSKLTQRSRAGFALPVTKQIRIGLDGDLVAFEGSNTEQGVQLLVSGWGVSLGYRVHGGYGGDLSGLVAYAHREITDRLSIDASVNQTSYEYGLLTGDDSGVVTTDDTATAGALGATWRCRPELSFTGQVEGMENAAFEHDVRFLGYVNWRFRTSL